jgi:dTDP-glucose 4,6-dehydratase
LGWSPQYTFETGLDKTIDWYLANGAWLAAIAKAKYQGQRLGLPEAQGEREA